MTRHDLGRVAASPDSTVRQVLEVVDRSAAAVALMVDGDGVLVGLLTDGDLRRALLGGADLDEAALPYATREPHCVRVGSARALVLDLMKALRIAAVPEVDERGRLMGLHTLSDVIGSEPLPNPAVVMAGGKGTRLGRLSEEVPKPLMEVAGRSILEWIVLTLVGGGIRDVYVSVNHLADQVVEHLGDGGHLGCSISYLREDPEKPLGTAGSLALFRAEHPRLADPVMVMNGDLMVQFEPHAMLEHHRRHGAALTVATRTYQHEVPFGVVSHEGDGSRIRSIEEKPTFSVDVNAGVYAVEPRVLDRIAPGEPSTMPQVVQDCLSAGEAVHAWPLSSSWIDVGTPADLARAKGQL